MTRLIMSMLFVASIILGQSAAFGQTYPSKPIRIVTYGAGGGNDLMARLIGQGISPALGQPVIVDNHGGGIQPGEFVSKAAPDGYTLLVAGVIYTIGHLLQDTPYDPIRDFEPISLVGISPLVLVVNPSVPAKSVKELIAYAKTHPGELNYATGGQGGASHLAAELFKSMAGGLHIVQINYNNAAPAMVATISGDCQVLFAPAAGLNQNISSGRLRALAETSLKPSALAPGLPPLAEAADLPGYQFAQFSVVVAPAKTPAPVITRLNQEIVRVLNQPDVKKKSLDVGVETVGSTPEELAAALKGEIARMGKVIKEQNIRVN